MNGFSGATAFPGLLVQNSSLSATSWGPNRWDVFGTYADGTLAHWWYDTGNTGYETIGGGLAPAGGLSAIGSATDSENRVDVFGVGSDQTLQHWWYPPPPGVDGFAWESLGGQMAVLDSPYAQPWGGPSVIWPGSGYLQVFASGADGSLLHWTLDGSQPETIEPPTPLAPLGGLSAVSWGPGRLDVFGAAADGTLLHWWAADESEWDALPQQVEGDLGGTLEHSPPPDPSEPPFPAIASPLSAVSWEPGRLDIFGVGSDQTLQHWWYFFDQATQSGGWNDGAAEPDSLGGKITAAPLAASTRNVPGTLDSFAPATSSESSGGDPMLLRWWYRFYPATSSGGWNDGSPDPQAFTNPLTDGPIGPPLTCVSRAPNVLDVFSCNAVGELVWWESVER
jgi:Repeat of unknown function (DUF346)